jgi:hypothetical protein
MGLLDSFTQEDLNKTERPIFTQGQVVELLILRIKEKQENDQLIVTCEVKNTEFKGAEYTLFLSKRNDFATKQWMNFLKAFWTMDELKAAAAANAAGEKSGLSLTQLIGRTMEAKAGKVTTSEKNGQLYQDLGSFKATAAPVETPLDPASVSY